MRTRFAVLGVLAVCAAFAVALTSGSAGASQGPSATARGASGQSSTNLGHSFAPPAACSPCLYYSGDFDGNNGLANEVDAIVTTGAHIYTPVTPDSQWVVSGLFVNSLNTFTPTSATWEIRTGVSSGNPGALVASGSGAVTQTPTGRSGFGITEYTDSVAISPSVTLSAGTTYWINVTPVCAACAGRAFESTTSGAGHVGVANISNLSFFNSVFFGANYANTNTECGGCALFSFGVSGTNGTLTVTKQVQSNSQDPGRWDLNIDGTTYASCVGNGGTTGAVPVASGYHDVSEDTCIPSGGFTTYITCSDGSHISNSTDLSGVYVAPGGSTTCTIRNVRKLYKVG
jgi:hypothetical protein